MIPAMSRFAASLLLILSFTGPVSAETEYPMELWRTETFRRRFMGSYGMNADVEPSVTVLERELMEKVMALMGEDDGLHRAQRLRARAVLHAHEDGEGHRHQEHGRQHADGDQQGNPPPSAILSGARQESNLGTRLLGSHFYPPNGSFTTKDTKN